MLVEPSVHGRHDAFVPLLATEPGHFRSREVGIDRQARDLRQPVSVPGQVARDGYRAPVLPAQGRPERLTGLAVPAEDGLALIREPGRLDGSTRRSDRRAARLDDRVEQLLRVLLHRAVRSGLRVNRGIAFAEDLAALGHDQRLGRRRALVDRQDVHALPNLHRRSGH